MKLGNIKTASIENLSKKEKVPDWFKIFLDESYNPFVEQATHALNGNLTPEDNFLCKVVDQEFTHVTELVVSPRLDGRAGLRAYGVIPISTSGETIDSLQWRVLENGNVGITIGFGSSVTAKCKLIILLR